MLEGKLGLNIDQAAGHDQVLGNPAGTLVFKCVDLMGSCPVQFASRDIGIDFRRTLAVRAVGTADVPGIRDAGGTVFPRAAVAAERTTVAAVTTGTVKVPRATLRTNTKRLTITIATKGTTIITITTGTVKVPRATLRTLTKRLTITIATKGTTIIAITTGTVITITARTVKVPRATLRTLTKRLTITIPTKGTTIITITTGTIKIPLTAVGTLAIGPPVAVAERPPLSVTGRTVAGRLTITIGAAVVIAVPVIAGTEAPRVTAGVVVGAERPAVTAVSAKVSAITAAIAAVVLSHYGFLLLRADQWRVRSRS